MMTRRQPLTRLIPATSIALAGLLLGLSLPASVALSEEEARQPSAEAGLELSRKLCKACHVVDEMGTASAPVGPPTFASIANKPGQTSEMIKGALIQPHPPMPDIHLSNDEIMDIIAYLDTLRTDKAAPSLLPPKSDSKPKFPAPT